MSAGYPIAADADIRSAGVTTPSRYSTAAVSAARFTVTDRTPGTSASALSTRPTQEAHDIDAMFRVTRSVRAGYPSFESASVASSRRPAPSMENLADSDARLTDTSETPSKAASAFSTRPTQEAQDIPSMLRVARVSVVMAAFLFQVRTHIKLPVTGISIGFTNFFSQVAGYRFPLTFRRLGNLFFAKKAERIFR